MLLAARPHYDGAIVRFAGLIGVLATDSNRLGVVALELRQQRTR